MLLIRPLTRWTVLLGLALAAVLLGCARYQVGPGTLYRPDLRTVYVPIFASESLRRNLGERLTEAVVKEIELKTPYKVVATPDADSTLFGRIVRETKHVTAENRYDDARAIQAELTVEVRWVNRRGELLMQRSALPLPQFSLEIEQTASFIPEGGQSLATAQQQALQRLAEEIVGQMERWW